jgi:hypothetical protein
MARSLLLFSSFFFFLAGSGKNLAQAIAHGEIFTSAQCHGDDLQLIPVGFLFPFWIVAFAHHGYQAGIGGR